MTEKLFHIIDLCSEIFYCLFLLVDNYGNCVFLSKAVGGSPRVIMETVVKDEQSPSTENKHKA